MKALRALFAVICAGIVPAPAWSVESYPSKPIRIIVPFPPGGGLDILARALAPRMTENLGGSVVVENRGGAGGIVGIEAVAKAPPDGYQILLVSASLTILPSLTSNARYDPVKDFAPITLATRQPYIAVVHPSLPVKNMKELINLARARPGQVTYASAGSGGAGHLGMELFKTMAKVDIVHIPYKGSGPALIDVLGGHVSLMFASAPSATPHIRNGRLRALGWTGSQQSAVMPGVPTIAESGLPGFEAFGWYGILATAGTSTEIVNRLHAAIIKALVAPEVGKRIVADGSEIVGNTPEQFSEFIKRDIPKFSKVIKDSGARAD
jgi:tripartite-type tricarboxylate transporter receptor subunit TctC